MAKGVYLSVELIESKAFHSLTGTSKEILLHFLLKRTFAKKKINGKRPCTNHDRINFAYTEARKKGFSQKRFTRSIDDLLAKGFISVVHPGGGFEKDKAVYSLLTEDGTSNKWALWHSGTVFERRQKDSIPRGFCNPKKV
uniref:Uncharacterized protein n=1 Tax=viral metagenome TaxID=1070528 RepID=A0A6M3LTP4_9ZZZZ